MNSGPAGGPDAAAGSAPIGPIVARVNQVLLVVVGLALALGLVRVASVLALTGLEKQYGILAALTLLLVGSGLLVGYRASYGLVINLVRTVGSAGSGLMFYIGSFVPNSVAPAISITLSLVVAAITFVPRVAVLGSAAVMLATSLFVFEAARLDYLVGLSVVATSLWMTAAALLVGNGLSEVFGPPAPSDPDSAPL